MENLHTIERSALIACLAALLCACGTTALPPAPAPAPRAAALPAPRFDITQAGSGQTTRYVYCEVLSCPVPSVKTAVPPAPTATQVYSPSASVDDSRDMKLIGDTKAMRSIVAHQPTGARVTERQEVAAPRPVAHAEQAMQRRGSLRFTPPTEVHMKGYAK